MPAPRKNTPQQAALERIRQAQQQTSNSGNAELLERLNARNRQIAENEAKNLPPEEQMPEAEHEFFCFRCGACCQHVDLIPELREFALESGVCQYWNGEEHACDVYEQRPAACNVRRSYIEKMDTENVSWDDFLFTTMLCCVVLRNREGMPEPDGSPFENMQDELAEIVTDDFVRLQTPNEETQ